MEVIAGKMVFGGDCIAENSEKKIFIPYTSPGEKVEIKIEKDFKDYSIAKNLNIVWGDSKTMIDFINQTNIDD